MLNLAQPINDDGDNVDDDDMVAGAAELSDNGLQSTDECTQLGSGCS